MLAACADLFAAEARPVYADERHSREARTLLYHAYLDDPVFQWLLDEANPDYMQRVRSTVREVFHAHLQEGMPIVGMELQGRLVGVGLVGCSEGGHDLIDQFGWRWRMMLTVGFGCTERYKHYHHQIAACLPRDRHCTLPLLGIAPRLQGRGLGAQMLQAIHRLCDADDSICGIGLATGHRVQLPFYLRMGYEVVGEVPVGEAHETVLFRPRGSSLGN